MPLSEDLLKFRAVVAIDFGTTNSGCAYGITANFNDDDGVEVMTVSLDGNPGLKTPTRIVLEKNPPHLPVGFGNEATANYDEDEGHLIFHQFKMQLYTRPMPTHVKADVGNGELPVKIVITRCLEYLRDATLEDMKYTNALDLTVDNIRWVLTVPAIWDDASKSLMTECAEQAGFCHSPGSLVLALEPECAALEAQETQKSLLKAGTRYLVVDCGGGTVDTVAFEVKQGLPTLDLKALHKPDGGNWGATSVDKRFLTLIDQVFGEEGDNRLAKFELLHTAWDLKKHTFNSKLLAGNKSVTVNVNTIMEFLDGQKKLKDYVAMYNHNCSDELKLKHFAASSLKIPGNVMLSFFEESFKQIEDHTKKLLTKIPNVQYVLLVGGFGSNSILQERLRAAVESVGSQLILPQRPSIAIVVGAVRFGFNTKVISERRSPQTYGIKTSETCPKGTFPNLARVTRAFAEKHRKPGPNGRGYILKDYFWKLVEVNEVVKSDKPFKHTFYPSNERFTSITLPIVSTQAANPVLTSEEGVREVGKLKMTVPRQGALKDRGIEVSIIFGDTQLEVKGKSIATGETVETKVTIAYS